MGDPKQVKAVIKSIREYSNFRQMAEYNISCLLTYITPPTVGWRENVAAAVEDGGIESIIHVLGKHKKALDMIKQATTALSGLAISKENAGKVADNGGIETALECMLNLGKDEPEVINAGAKLMETVARFNPESVMKSKGAIQSMLQGVQYSQVPRVQIASAKVLDRIANFDQGLLMIVQQGGIKALINSIGAGKPTQEEMLRPIFRILEKLARNPDYIAEIRKCKGVEALVAQLDAHADNEYILRAGGRLLAKIADSDIEETIRRMGGKLSPQVRQHLVGLLANLALQPENAEKIVAKGGIEALLKGFEKYNPATKAAALRALQRIADANGDFAAMIVAKGGLPKIIGAIRGAKGNEDVLRAGIAALTSIAGSSLDLANQIAKLGGIDAVIEAMLKNPHLPGVAQAGLEFLEKLAAIGFSVEDLVKAGAINAIFATMKASMDDKEVQVKGFEAISGLLNSKDEKHGKFAADAIANHVDLGVLPQSLVRHKTEKNNVRKGVAALASLVALSEPARRVLKEDVMLGSIVEAVFAQIKAEMLGLGRLSSDTAYMKSLRGLLSSLVSVNDVKGLAQSVARMTGKKKSLCLHKISVFSISPELNQGLLKEDVTQGVSISIKNVVESDSEDRNDMLEDHAVTIWSLAKSGIQAMGELFENGSVKHIIAASKGPTATCEAVVALLRSLNIFATNADLRDRLVAEMNVLGACVTAMRSNATQPTAQLAAIELMISLSASDKAATQICFSNAGKQVLKMIKESAISPEFEKAIEKALVLVYRIASVEKSDVKERLRTQGAVEQVTVAMSSFPSNPTIIEMGGRILALLMSPEDVADAIDKVVQLTADLRNTKRPDKIFVPLGQKAATVGFLALNPANREIMESKDAKQVLRRAIGTSKAKPMTTARENAVMNEYRALGQVGGVVGGEKLVSELIAALKDSEDKTSLTEKVGVLQAISNLCNHKPTLDRLLKEEAPKHVLDLIRLNRSDERVLRAGLDALTALMGSPQGVEEVARFGGTELVFNILRDDADLLTPFSAEAALKALQKLAQRKAAANQLVADGLIDTVTSTVELQCEDSDEPRPGLVSAAAGLVQALTNGNDEAKDLAVKKGFARKMIDISASSPEYLTNSPCMMEVLGLLNSLCDVEDLRAKMRDNGAVDFVIQAMNLNPGNEPLETIGQEVLQKLVGGDVQALEQTLKEYDRLLAQVKRNPESRAALERLLRANNQLGRLMMIAGAVDPQGAGKIVDRAIDTYNVVKKSSAKVGPVKDGLFEGTIENIGKSTLVDGAMAQIDLKRALQLLEDALKNKNPAVQLSALNALKKILGENEEAFKMVLGTGLLAQVTDLMEVSASPEVKEAAKQALDKAREMGMKNPKLLLTAKDSDILLAALLKGTTDPEALNKFLEMLTDEPHGADALLRLALGELSPQLGPDLRAAIVRALGNAPPGVLKLDASMIKDITDALKDPNVDPDTKIALLKLLAESNINPNFTKAVIDNKTIEALLDLLKNNKDGKNTDLLAAALQALGKLGKDEMMGGRIVALDGANLITQVMMKHEGDKEIQQRGFDALANLRDATNGPENLDLTNEQLIYLEGALDALNPGQRGRAKKLIEDLKNLINGEMEPMVISRFDNMLDLLNKAKNWRELHDEKGRPYYYNVVTKETTWTKPPELIAAERAMERLRELAEKSPADIDLDKLKAAIGHFSDQTAEPLRLRALAKALAALANNPNNRDAMVRHGVLNALVKALKGGNVDREFILAAIALLNQFAHHPEYKEQIAKFGGIEALIAIMMKYLKDEEIVFRCEQCLSNLAYQSDYCSAKIAAKGGINAVGHAMKQHKESIEVNQYALAMCNNLMYQSTERKQNVGDVLRDKVLRILKGLFRSKDVFYQAARAVGNIAFIDEHVRGMIRKHVVSILVNATVHHKQDLKLLKLGIDVIGNLAFVDEAQYEQEIRTGAMVSVLSTIWHEGGAKMIVDTFGEANTPEIVASCIKALKHLYSDPEIARKLVGMNVVPLIFEAMTKYETDEDITDFCIDSIQFLSEYPEGVESIADNDGVQSLVTQMESNTERTEHCTTIILALHNMCVLKHQYREVSVKVMNDLAQQGLPTIFNTLEYNIADPEISIATMKLLSTLATLRDDVSLDIAQQGMRNILKCVKNHELNPKVLIAAYQLIGVLAFEKPNLKVIVQYGGINLIISSVLKFPDDHVLVKRSVRTLDNIALASTEHSNIVKEANGKKVIDEVIKTYKTIPGPAAAEVVKACKAALLSLNKIETRKLDKTLFFVDKEENDPNADPLKRHRVLLKTGATMFLHKRGNAKRVHLLVKDLSFSIIWKIPGKTKVIGKMEISNVAEVRPKLSTGHDRKADPETCFSLVGLDKKVFCFQTKSKEETDAWISALEALRLTFRSKSSKWLHL